MEEVLQKYPLGEVTKIKQVTGGIINATFVVDTSEGKFILQEIRDKRMTQDHEAIERYLESRVSKSDLQIPTQIKTKNGELYVESKGKIFRVMNHIKSQDIVFLTPGLCHNLGESLATFHLQTAEFNEELKYSIPNFHNTPTIINRLKKIKIEYESTKKWELVSNYYNQIISDVENFYLPDSPIRLIHGDPKWQNFLYEAGRVNAIIDLETLMYGNELIDIGDALRSWSKDKNYNFIKENYDSAVEGYISKNKSVQEELIPNSMALITLELSARFLIDYFEQSYFRNRKTDWDSEENFRRLENQMKFYEDMKSQLEFHSINYLGEFIKGNYESAVEG